MAIIVAFCVGTGVGIVLWILAEEFMDGISARVAGWVASKARRRG